MFRTLGTAFLFFIISHVALGATDTFLVRTIVGYDVTPPTTPTLLSATPVSISQINLSWSTSTDDLLLSGYQVFRDAVQVATTGTETTYSDSGLSASTTYSYFVRAFDSMFNTSSSSNIIATTTLSISPPTPTTTPTTPPSRGSKKRLPLSEEITYLQVIPSETSAELIFNTEGYTRSVIKWGRTGSYELGSLSEDKFHKSHKATVTGLMPDTLYNFVIEGENHLGVYGVMTIGKFKTLEGVDKSAPSKSSY